MPTKKAVCFYRNYQGFTGGHLKVWDYYHHVKHSHDFSPCIFFGKESIFEAENPWKEDHDGRMPEWEPEKAEVLFLGGDDWLSLPESQRRSWPGPVINLVQGVSHADPGTLLYSFLANRAIRICVSKEVEQEILKTDQVNGPLFTIPNGIDPSLFPEKKMRYQEREIDLLIAGTKNPDLAMELFRQVNHKSLVIRVVDDQIPRQEFLSLLGESRITLFLPGRREGFYLPALEGMAAGTLVICPDCVGNRSYCIDFMNCIRPDYSGEALLSAVGYAGKMSPAATEMMLSYARETLLAHTLEGERTAFLEILTSVHQLWEEKPEIKIMKS
jgi:glycosyltransferase involved in cell wall biosynthesis